MLYIYITLRVRSKLENLTGNINEMSSRVTRAALRLLSELVCEYVRKNPKIIDPLADQSTNKETNL
jgi:hypothetical protein